MAQRTAANQSEPKPEPGRRVRGLMRAATTAALGTCTDDGTPYVSLVLSTVDHDASPLLLLSELAEHTRNLRANPAVSLLYDGTAGRDDRLAGPRATVQGQARIIEDPRCLDRLTARHPDAAVYRDFKDFHLFRVDIERAHLVAGFGRIDWVEAGAVRLETGLDGDLAAREADIVRHMNLDHGDAVQLLAGVLLGLDGRDWRLVGVDPEGCDLRRAGMLTRLPFDRPVADAESCRAALVELAGRARRQAAGGVVGTAP